jgi:hypothetical protein
VCGGRLRRGTYFVQLARTYFDEGHFQKWTMVVFEPVEEPFPRTGIGVRTIVLDDGDDQEGRRDVAH